MSDSSSAQASEQGWASKVALYWLAILLVVMGLFNTIPGIPGLDDGLKTLTGQSDFKIRKFPSEIFFPLAL